MRAGTRGSFISALELTRDNDTNAANDARDVAFEIAGSSRRGGGSEVRRRRRRPLRVAGLALLALLACCGNGVRPHFLANGVLTPI